MKKIISILALFAILFLPLKTFAVAIWMDFQKDVNELWAAQYLADLWVIVDHKNDTDKYNFNSNILRQEMAWMVLKILRKAPNKSYCENVFSDVRTTSQNSWACPAIEELYHSWVIAKNDKFRPLSNVSKAEVIAFFVNALYKDKLDEYKAKNPNLSC